MRRSERIEPTEGTAFPLALRDLKIGCAGSDMRLRRNRSSKGDHCADKYPLRVQCKTPLRGASLMLDLVDVHTDLANT